MTTQGPVLIHSPRNLADNYSTAASHIYGRASNGEDFLRILKVAVLFFSLGAGLSKNRAFETVALAGKTIYATGAAAVRIPKAVNFLRNPREKETSDELSRAFAVMSPILFGSAALFSWLKLAGKFNVLPGMESFGNIGTCFSGTIGSGIASAASFHSAFLNNKAYKAMDTGRDHLLEELRKHEQERTGEEPTSEHLTSWDTVVRRVTDLETQEKRAPGLNLEEYRELGSLRVYKAQKEKLDFALSEAKWGRTNSIVGGAKYASMLVATLVGSFLIPRLKLTPVATTWIVFGINAVPAGLGLGQVVFNCKKPKKT